jgi:hypothetical protein
VVPGGVSIAYITLSVPLHIYFSVVRGDVSFFVRAFPVWFSYLLLCARLKQTVGQLDLRTNNRSVRLSPTRPALSLDSPMN